MTQSDWESIGDLIGMFIIVVTVIWFMTRDDDYFDGGW